MTALLLILRKQLFIQSIIFATNIADTAPTIIKSIIFTNKMSSTAYIIFIVTY